MDDDGALGSCGTTTLYLAADTQSSFATVVHYRGGVVASSFMYRFRTKNETAPDGEIRRATKAVIGSDRHASAIGRPIAAPSRRRTSRIVGQQRTPSRRVVARIEATRKGLDTRYVVTNITYGTPAWLYDSVYCARGQAENLIKRHKSQLASDPDQIPVAAGQPDEADPAHCRLLADADCAR